MNWDKASEELAKDLDRKRDGEDIVKTRVGGGGTKLSYIEGWRAIAEANRIFGFDGWDRETVEIRQVSDKPVAYFAKVRVTVDTRVVREGCGYGNGFGNDAHELAIKEAETDATKRALMTFGWPFGLALYDKTQEHVSDGNGHAEPASKGFGGWEPDKPPSAYKGSTIIHPETPPGKKGVGPSAYSVKDTPLWKELEKHTDLDALDIWFNTTETQDNKSKMPFGHQIDLFERFIMRGCDIAESEPAMMGFIKAYDHLLSDMKSIDDNRYKDLLAHVKDTKVQLKKVEAAHAG